MAELSRLTDGELVELSRQGDETADDELFARYNRTVTRIARRYFIIGAADDDRIQEGMIGLFRAIRDYRPERHASFRAFAELCVERQVITAVKAANRLKHTPLNTYVSVDMPAYGEGDRTVGDVIGPVSLLDPETIVIGRETCDRLQTQLDSRLSPLERQVLALYIDGANYRDVAARLGKSEKSIDNAIQRIKKKAEALLASE